MTRQNYIHDIMRKLNDIEGLKDYSFQFKTADYIAGQLCDTAKIGVEQVNSWKSADIKKGKAAMARLAAMCMIVMDVADMKLDYNEKHRRI